MGLLLYSWVLSWIPRGLIFSCRLWISRSSFWLNTSRWFLRCSQWWSRLYLWAGVTRLDAHPASGLSTRIGRWLKLFTCNNCFTSWSNFVHAVLILCMSFLSCLMELFQLTLPFWTFNFLFLFFIHPVLSLGFNHDFFKGWLHQMLCLQVLLKLPKIRLVYQLFRIKTWWHEQSLLIADIWSIGELCIIDPMKNIVVKDINIRIRVCWSKQKGGTIL